MKGVTYLILIIFYTNYTVAQDCNNLIRFKELGMYYKYEDITNPLVDTIDNIIIKIDVKNCTGKMKVSSYIKEGHILSVGMYTNGTLTKDTILKEQDVPPFDIIKYPIEFYEPKKDGLWKYWDKKGKFMKKEKWKKGILVGSVR